MLQSSPTSSDLFSVAIGGANEENIYWICFVIRTRHELQDGLQVRFDDVA